VCLGLAHRPRRLRVELARFRQPARLPGNTLLSSSRTNTTHE
jgi:hypothetical protein